jgi:hypothetical protein
VFIRYNETNQFWEYDTSGGAGSSWAPLPLAVPVGSLPANVALTDKHNTFSTAQSFAGLVDFTAAYTQFTGIYIPGPVTTNPLVLDDYEEGSWTPSLISDVGGQGTSYSRQEGYYVKIGSLVHCTFSVIIQAANWTTGSIHLTGLPFFNIGAFTSGTVGFFANIINGTVYSLYLLLTGGQNTITIYYKNIASGGIDGYLQANNVAPGFELHGNISYRTDS